MALDNEFNVLLAARNHKELIKKLDQILQELSGKESKEVDTSGIEEVIKSLSIAKELEKTTKAIDAMVNVISQKLDERKQETKAWTFKVERDADGFIDVVKATSD